jgi:hypothetical protein
VSAEDDKHSRWPGTCRTTEECWKIRELIHEDGCQTIHDLTDTAEISYGVCQEILTENVCMHCIAAKFVPRLLTVDHSLWLITILLSFLILPTHRT